MSGNRIIFSKGYGFANLEQRVPVDPDKTLFRIASVSRVFNAMAVMRLVDEGLIDVNKDVRPRLAAAGLELDHQAWGPITMKELLTHTAGKQTLASNPYAGVVKCHSVTARDQPMHFFKINWHFSFSADIYW